MKTIALFVFGAVLITACAPASTPAPTQDVSFIQTAAAQTVFANLTATASAWTATPLPPPSSTPTSIAVSTAGATPAITPTLPGGITATPTLCDALTFDPATVDVNVPDNTQMTAGQQFVKTWRVRNNGSCTWGAGYGLVYAGYSDQMSGKPQPLAGAVAPGQEVDVSVQFIAPNKAGQYVSAWEMANANGKPFPKVIFVKIIVK
jgi:hypothetical protein